MDAEKFDFTNMAVTKALTDMCFSYERMSRVLHRFVLYIRRERLITFNTFSNRPARVIIFSHV